MSIFYQYHGHSAFTRHPHPPCTALLLPLLFLSGVLSTRECEISNDAKTLFLRGKRVIPDFSHPQEIPRYRGESYEIWDDQYHLQHRVDMTPKFIQYTNGPLIGRDYVFEMDWSHYPLEDHITPPPRYTYVVLSGAGSCLRYWKGVHLADINKITAYPLIDAK